MKRLIILLVAILPHVGIAQNSQGVTVVKFNEVEKIIAQSSNEVQVINFWATWCGPCVKELPEFQTVLSENPGQVEMHFISLDFADKIRKVTEFVNSRSLDGHFLLLDEIDYNSWIDQVDPSWSGAIPATLFINTKTGERIFVENELTADEIRFNITSLTKRP